MKTMHWIPLFSLCSGCTVGTIGHFPGADGGTDGGEATDTGASTTGTTTDDEAGEDGGTGSDLMFDLWPILDLPNEMGIPETCGQAIEGETSVGCMFFTADLDSNVDKIQFATVVSNVQEQTPAMVTVRRRDGDQWTIIAGPVEIPPLALHEFDFADFHFEGTGIKPGGAYQIESDVPVIAYQFNPIDGVNSALSDASLLYPVSTWDHLNRVVSLGASTQGEPFVTVAAAFDDTQVTVVPTTATMGGSGIAAAQAGQPIVFALDAGDTASINPQNSFIPLTGTSVETDAEHPVAVFSGHTCANIPGDVCCCDHLEEQMAGLRTWGKSFVAAHVPVRDTPDPEPTFWQIFASENGTTIDLEATPGVTGLPGNPVKLEKGEIVEMYVTAPPGIEADFRVEADRPIALVGYMIGSGNLAQEFPDVGDPAMIQFPPVEQFLPRYVVLVPGSWINDALILTREAGASVSIDDVAVPDDQFWPVGDGDWEAARVIVEDGVHVLDGAGTGFGVVVIGWDNYDSYAYVGGAGTVRINPDPEG